MPHIPTEDVEYDGSVDDFAIEDEFTSDISDEEQSAETKVIQEIRQYLAEAETEHNTFDIIDLTEQAKMTPTQQIAVHKQVVHHLRNIKGIINNKVREN